jgi:hypothetical protein
MNYATNIALIDKETNLVTNVIWGMIYQQEEFNTDTQLAVVINDLAVSTGDTYDGEHFYHEGEKVLTTAEQMAAMQAELEKAKADLADADAALGELGVEW